MNYLVRTVQAENIMRSSLLGCRLYNVLAYTESGYVSGDVFEGMFCLTILKDQPDKLYPYYTVTPYSVEYIPNQDFPKFKTTGWNYKGHVNPCSKYIHYDKTLLGYTDISDQEKGILQEYLDILEIAVNTSPQ